MRNMLFPASEAVESIKGMVYFCLLMSAM